MMQKRVEPTKRFSSRVDNYVRYRPDYPVEIVDLLRQECGLTKNSIVADIGSGTGKLSELFVNAGCQVFGVEPNQEMREAGERMGFQNFTSIEGTAEATTVPQGSVDFITVGQAFHWFNHKQCRAEFLRILKPNGWVAIVWNDRSTDATPFLADYEKLMLEFGTDYKEVNHRRTDKLEIIATFFGTPPRAKTFLNVQQFDFAGLRGRVLSSSYAPEAGPRHEAMLAELKRIFDERQTSGFVNFEYETRVHYGHLVQTTLRL